MEYYTNEIALIFSIILTSFSQLLLRVGAKKSNTANVHLFNLYTITGYVLFLGVMLLMIYAMQKIPLRTAIACNSLTYILTPVLAHMCIKDPINKRILLGSLIIMLGILIFLL